MTEEARRAFHCEPPHTEGPHPQTEVLTSLIGVLDDDGDILLTTAAESLKGRTLRRDPRAALCVDDERPPFSFVIVTAVAELIDDLAEVRHWAGIIGGRYMGADEADAYGERNGVPGEILVRLRPTNIVSEKDLAL
jgi:PPOX class probable F420-dependent enzyme